MPASPLEAEVLDIDADGHSEVWVHNAAFSAIVSPARGGVIEEYTVFGPGINYANTLTRRREVYHLVSSAPGGHDPGRQEGNAEHSRSGGPHTAQRAAAG